MAQPMRLLALLTVACAASAAFAQGGSRGATNPFSAPDAKLQFAPDRTYDLQNLVLDFDVDYPNRSLTATSINSIQALLDGTKQFRFHAGPGVTVDLAEIDGKPAHFTRDAEGILVDTAPTKAGAKYVVTVHYHVPKGAQGGGGWHWHEPSKSDPSKMGFFTNGETSDTRDWAVTWDYPNDFTTTETRTTVPADWAVIGNGLQISDTPTPDHQRHTVVWRMTQAHATYLTSLVAGPFDIHKDNWRGVPLYYVAPKGMGDKLDYSFAHTKDILSFYSDTLGVKYPWPKYAQDITYDFGGGQENVSATTYGTFLTTPRDDRYAMDWIIAHETGHQWFGDYVTCKDWGQIWLNESFATFMEMAYTLHSRGPNASMREVEANSQGYFAESTRYKRPMATNFYSSPGVMFDQHTYPKGGVLLMSLRSQIGDQAFYAGLNRYLSLHHNGPVESNDLCEAMTDASGINLHPWFDQWIYKPGHPVIDWSWSWDEPKKEVVVHVKQTQDLTHGSPVYDVPATVGLLRHQQLAGPNANIMRSPVHLNAADQEFRIAAGSKPDAVVLDPDHQFLREIPKQPWAAQELLPVLQYDPNPVDRAYALDKLLQGTLSDGDLRTIVGVLKDDAAEDPGIIDTHRLANLKRPDLVAFWEGELNHANYDRRATAVDALGMLTGDPAIRSRIAAMMSDQQPYRVVAAAITALAGQDFAGNRVQILELAKTSDNRQIRSAALDAFAKAGAPEAADLIFGAAADSQTGEVRAAGIHALRSLKGDDPRLVPTLRGALGSGDFGVMFEASDIAGDRKLKELLPDLEALKKKYPFASAGIDASIAKINGKV